MSLNRTHRLSRVTDTEIDTKKRSVLIRDAVNPRGLNQGDRAYDPNTGIDYIKVNTKLVPLLHDMFTPTIELPRTSISENTTILTFASVIELHSLAKEQIISEQYGDYVRPISIPVSFSKVNSIYATYTLTNGVEGTFQNMFGKLSGGPMSVVKGNHLKMAMKITDDYKVRLTLRQYSGNNDAPVNSCIFVTTAVMTSGMQVSYLDHNLAVIMNINMEVAI